MIKTSLVDISIRNGCIWVMLPDSIDMDNYVRIERKILAEIETEHLDVVLDFSNTNNLFSSGIGMIIRINSAAAGAKLRLSVLNMNAKLKDSLKNVGLDAIFDLSASGDSSCEKKDDV